MQRRRQAGAAAADHHEVGFDLAFERRIARRRIGRRHVVGFLDVEPGIETHRSHFQQQMVALPRGDHALERIEFDLFEAQEGLHERLAEQRPHRLAGGQPV